MAAHRQDVYCEVNREGWSDHGSSPNSFVVRACRLALVLVALVLSGCSSLRLPAIDPSGNRLFLPGNSTSLLCPKLHTDNNQAGVFPSPAYREPPPPPACLAGPSVVPTTASTGLVSHRSDNDRGRCGQLLLTPTRIVAPVNGDVVLMSGICGEDGYLVAGETIEWMISPESVGQIVEVGDDGSSGNQGWFHRSPSQVQKLGVDFAKGMTAFEDRLVTRGSAKLSDDLKVKKGQTWISLTSPSEGTTRITALAPNAEVWDQRRQTATIYWVDARWNFPAPIGVASTAPIDLVTRVTRKEGFAPAKDWIVRYRSLDPTLAVFAPSNADIAEVRVDADGKAAVQVVNASGKNGSAAIAIQIIRPPVESENMPELPLANGQTVVTWSLPDLRLEVAGPAVGAIGEVLNFHAALLNLGNLPAENARVTAVIPANMRLVGTSHNPTQSSPTNLAWDIGSLQPGHRFDVDLQLSPEAESDYRTQFNASSTAGSTDIKIVSTEVRQASVGIRYAPAIGYEQVEVGQQVPMNIVVTNNGRTSLGNIEVRLENAEGLQHARENASVVTQSISNLRPGESRQLNPLFVARQVGALSSTAIVLSGQTELARQSTTVQVVEAVRREPRLSIALSSDQPNNNIRVGQRITTDAMVVNSGQVPLQNVQVSISYSASLEPKQATADQRQDYFEQRRMVWTIPLLDVGMSYRPAVQFQFDGSETAPQVTATAQSSAEVRADAVLRMTGISDSGAAILPPQSGSDTVLPPGSVLPPTTGGGVNIPPPTNSGGVLPPGSILPNNQAGFQITLEPVNPTVRVGSTARYVITLANMRPTPDQSVALVVDLPPGTQLSGVSTPDGRTVQFNVTQNGQQVAFEPVRYVAGNERLGFIINIQHNLPGPAQIRASVTSATDSRGAQTATTATVVN